MAEDLKKLLEEERASKAALLAQVEQLTSLLQSIQDGINAKKEQGTARSRRNNAVTKCKVAFADANGYEPTEAEIVAAMATMKKRN